MITDTSFLESGFSEEFSLDINPLLESGIMSKIKNMFKKAGGKKSDFKSNHIKSKSRKSHKELPENVQKARDDFLKQFYKELSPKAKSLINKYPIAGKAFGVYTYNDNTGNDMFIDGSYNTIYLIDYNIWDHPKVMSNEVNAREYVFDPEFDDELIDLIGTVCEELSKLGYGNFDFDSDWDEGCIVATNVTSSKKYKEFMSKNLKTESRQEEPCTADIKRNMDEVEDTDIFFNSLELRKDLGNEEIFVDDVIGKEVKDSIGTVYGTTTNNTLIYDGAFDDYLRTQMDNELRLQEAMMGYLNEAGGGGRLQDTVAKRWDAFCKFIDGILDRFWAAMDKILNSQKNYLEKYQDIILKKAPREDIEYEYTGDYTEGVDRCLNTQLPAFNYERDAAFLRQDGYESSVKDFMSGKNFKYNKDEDLAAQFKNWFIAAERGQTKGKLSNLNMKSIYDFCYDTKTLANSIKRDRANLQQTRNQLINAVNKELREKGETTQTNQNTNTATNSTGSAQAAANNNNTTANTNVNTTTNTTAQNASAIDDNLNGWVNLSEAEGDNNNNQNNNANDNKAGATGLEITNNGAEKKDANGNTTKDGDNEAAGKGNTTEQDIKNIVTKWTNISRSFCTGKLTAVQQISKDYMNLIKAHVRSYGGKGTDGAKQDQNANNGQNNTGAAGGAQAEENKK